MCFSPLNRTFPFSGLIHLQDIYDTFNDSNKPLDVVVRRVEDLDNSHKMLRQLDRIDRPLDPRNIVVVMSSTSAYRRLLNQVSTFFFTSETQIRARLERV